MFKYGYTELSSYFENASFPVMLLNTDLKIEYMNTEAENCFGKYLRKADWEKVYLEQDITRQVKHCLKKGETVVLTPPQVKDFSMILLQPILGKDGIPELVRMNIEVFCDIRRKYEQYNNNQGLFDYICNSMTNEIKTMELSLKILKNNDKNEENGMYYKLLENSINDFKHSFLNFEYLFEIIKRNDIAKGSVFNPRLDIQQIAESTDGVEYTDLIGKDSCIFYDRSALETAIKTIIQYTQTVAGTRSVKMKSYEKDPYFVFVFTAEKCEDNAKDNTSLNELSAAMDIIKLRAEENGGNLREINSEDQIKVMYSIKKHIRSEYSTIFNQDQIQL